MDRQAESDVTSFAYDDAGRVVTRTDSRGIVTTTLYDEINRPTSVSFSDGTPAITSTYDLGSYGIGRLYSLGNSVATSTYTYNHMGQVTREDKTINGIPFYTTYGYNLAGAVTTARLPNGTILTNNYDGIGRLASLTSDWVDGNHPATLASGFVYGAAGAVMQMDFGNGRRMARTFNSGLQLKTLRHGTPEIPGWNLDLEYNYDESVSNNGRIMGIITYHDRTKDLIFTYDRLYRLATAETAGSHWGLAWTYDRYGNRLTQSLTKGTAPTSSLTYSNTTNRVNGWTYDNAGNTTNDGRHAYTWNALNQQTTMDGGAAEYRYDAQGNRVLKITPAKTTYYVFGTGEYSGGVWEKLYVSLNGQKLVEYSNNTTYFFHCDHLGTPRVQTDISGAVVETWEAYPFGEQWTMSGGVGNKHHYTGKERDPESSNDYFGARYYWNGAGRWLSADSVGEGIYPQHLNRYMYVRNDPVNFIDPDGRMTYPWSEGDGTPKPTSGDGDLFWGGIWIYAEDAEIPGKWRQVYYWYWEWTAGGGGGGGGDSEAAKWLKCGNQLLAFLDALPLNQMGPAGAIALDLGSFMSTNLTLLADGKITGKDFGFALGNLLTGVNGATVGGLTNLIAIENLPLGALLGFINNGATMYIEFLQLDVAAPKSERTLSISEKEVLNQSDLRSTLGAVAGFFTEKLGFGNFAQQLYRDCGVTETK